MYLFIVLFIIYYVSYHLYRYFFSSTDIDPTGRYVLISGCDTGFGHVLALELDKQGFNVLAGVYLLDNVAALTNELSPKATVFRLDITKQEDIDVAFELIKAKTNTLHGLVNNAGILDSGYIDWTSLETYRAVMNVNFFGHVAMTKTFLSLLISRRHSRVVNICSIGGFLSFPRVSSYCASKYALESFSDCLRREMVPWGLHVSIIEPGAMQTPLLGAEERCLRKSWGVLSTDVQERWGVEFFNDTITIAVNNPMIINADNPNKVVRAIQHALINSNPWIRYRPGWVAKLVFILYSVCPNRIWDTLLNPASNPIPAAVRNRLVNEK